MAIVVVGGDGGRVGVVVVTQNKPLRSPRTSTSICPYDTAVLILSLESMSEWRCRCRGAPRKSTPRFKDDRVRGRVRVLLESGCVADAPRGPVVPVFRSSRSFLPASTIHGPPLVSRHVQELFRSLPDESRREIPREPRRVSKRSTYLFQTMTHHAGTSSSTSKLYHVWYMIGFAPGCVLNHRLYFPTSAGCASALPLQQEAAVAAADVAELDRRLRSPPLRRPLAPAYVGVLRRNARTGGSSSARQSQICMQNSRGFPTNTLPRVSPFLSFHTICLLDVHSRE